MSKIIFGLEQQLNKLHIESLSVKAKRDLEKEEEYEQLDIVEECQKLQQDVIDRLDRVIERAKQTRKEVKDAQSTKKSNK